MDNHLELIASGTLLVLVLLLIPLARIMKNPEAATDMAQFVKTSVLLAFLASLFPLSHHLQFKQDVSTMDLPIIYTDSFQMSLGFNLDFYALVFIPVGLFVTWCILDFTLWYMSSDPNIGRFYMHLLIFLFAMMFLVTSNHLYQLFIGWEGVGMMSFLLIGWWCGRSDANTAALQAVGYNRVGDIGFLFLMAGCLAAFNSWTISEIIALAQEKGALPILVAAIIAATGKSAQFGLHPWLPAAMEGPTPVSSLLRSSTMVIAGIFLLIRFGDLLIANPISLTVCLWLGALTTLFTAFCALTQNDIKKVIAFSTSSQLGLMMVTVGLGQPQLAFFHICTHAFFKAMLFLCAGAVIHCLNDEQDVRKMGGLFRHAPFTSSALILGNLALTGTPFLSGFFSKDAIIEAMNTSHLNAWALFVTLVATALTAAYSLRLTFYVLVGNNRTLPLSPINENDPHVIGPLKRLAMGSIVAGYLILNSVLPDKTPILTMATPLKMAALGVTIAGVLVAMEMVYLVAKHFKLRPKSGPHRFSNLLGFFPLITHRALPKSSMMMGQKLAAQNLDRSWLGKTGPKAATSSNRRLATTTSDIQRGMLITHLGMFLLTLTLAIILGTRV
ncbi:NADH dehydrogenase subunit 5 (mitochondrion) [Halichoeres trimaculatus]|uniref:NADH-ubiquinone oxidoreductase chain 5 n=1 Tax=Halichoeres trimaculatus TaxID=147232 RepID=B5KMS4_HALTR|nr:NADH dehydrogenase subunit 5 [Halichoeres trimaculatus]ABU40252.1 NADH dehydrogenase subunit 5 [Halichoeres trimaculatus]